MSTGLVLSGRAESLSNIRGWLKCVLGWIRARRLHLRAEPYAWRLDERLRRDIGMTQAEADWAFLRHSCSGRGLVDPPGTDPWRALANRPPA